MKLTYDEIIRATKAQIIKSNNEFTAEYGFSTDTRTIKPGEIYIPLKGENFDGENFIENAVSAGAAGSFTSDKSKIPAACNLAFLVKDTKEAYLRLAKFYKDKINPYTIMITGSSGKTTVKEMMFSVFSRNGNTVKSMQNHNNEIGLCQTESALEKNSKYLIVEAGMRGFGEIELISKYTEPDIAVIVNAGTAHIGRLGSELNIAKAKFEITSYLKPNGVLISHDNENIRKINDNKHKTIYFTLNSPDLKIKETDENGSIFEYKGYEYKLNVSGEHNIQNALSVIEAALLAGIDEKTIKDGLENFVPIEKRWQKEQAGDFTIICDCYNSNPDSVKAAIKTFLDHTPSPKVLILGDMGELGADERKYHEETGKYIENFDCDYVLTVGELAKLINPANVKCYRFDNKAELVDFALKNLPKGANILLKASRFMKFEEITEGIKAGYGI